MTLDKLTAAGDVDYRAGMLARRYTETASGVRVEGTRIGPDIPFAIEGKKLVLAAGAIGTTKIVLRSFEDYATRLRLLENPAVQVPLVLPSSIGARLNSTAFGLVQLNLVWRSKTYGALLQGSIMEVTSPMRAEFFTHLPFSAPANLGLIRNLLPGMLVMQMFWPGAAQEPARISLQASGHLRIEGCPNQIDLKKTAPLVRHLRRIGAWTHPTLMSRVPTGHAIHYAGTLPMRLEPDRYECDPTGRLHGSQNVFIGDSASFSALPAKNMSFAMMANAMRIAAHISREPSTHQ